MARVADAEAAPVRRPEEMDFFAAMALAEYNREEPLRQRQARNAPALPPGTRMCCPPRARVEEFEPPPGTYGTEMHQMLRLGTAAISNLGDANSELHSVINDLTGTLALNKRITSFESQWLDAVTALQLKRLRRHMEEAQRPLTAGGGGAAPAADHYSPPPLAATQSPTFRRFTPQALGLSPPRSRRTNRGRQPPLSILQHASHLL
eukprot:TRINITY_DN9706_c0_g1_i2.p1 TRINITY_DN9706_c0_g1~~TRINITY_DN9706_c0_g1_i2.p1  ORF type:complete len:224 (-),score=67.37 TRINITY_DN9706_c0_g1_i2:65-682(-)